MKRILLIMAIAFISILANAQDITVSGIKLGSTKNDLIKILNEKKYKYQIEDKYIYVSDYTNSLSMAIWNMMIGLNADRIKYIGLACEKGVKIFDNYDNIVSKLKEKYGEPTSVVEKYYSPYSENYRDYPLSAIEYVNEHGTTWKINDYTYIRVYITKSSLHVLYSDTRYQDKETTSDY
jgi:hypothetical protein